MSKTSLSVAEARAQLPADGKRLLRIGNSSGTPDFTRTGLDGKIIEVTAFYKGDLARAQALRTSLAARESCGFSLDERGAEVYPPREGVPDPPVEPPRHGQFQRKVDQDGRGAAASGR